MWSSIKSPQTDRPIQFQAINNPPGFFYKKSSFSKDNPEFNDLRWYQTVSNFPPAIPVSYQSASHPSTSYPDSLLTHDPILHNPSETPNLYSNVYLQPPQHSTESWSTIPPSLPISTDRAQVISSPSLAPWGPIGSGSLHSGGVQSSSQIDSSNQGVNVPDEVAITPPPHPQNAVVTKSDSPQSVLVAAHVETYYHDIFGNSNDKSINPSPTQILIPSDSVPDVPDATSSDTPSPISQQQPFLPLTSVPFYRYIYQPSPKMTQPYSVGFHGEFSNSFGSVLPQSQGSYGERQSEESDPSIQQPQPAASSSL